MKTGLKRTLIGCGFTLALVAGGSIAFAANQTTPPQNGFQSFLDDVAGRLNVTPAALQTAIQGAETDRVQSALQSGKITQAQAANIEGRIKSGKIGGAFMFRGRRGPLLGLMRGAATYLGVTPQVLMSDLRSGKSPAQIAQSQGKSVAGLEQALLQPIQTRLQQAVQSGKITQAQATTRLSAMQTRIGKIVNHVFGAKGAGVSPGTTTQP